DFAVLLNDHTGDRRAGVTGEFPRELSVAVERRVQSAADVQPGDGVLRSIQSLAETAGQDNLAEVWVARRRTIGVDGNRVGGFHFAETDDALAVAVKGRVERPVLVQASDGEVAVVEAEDAAAVEVTAD